MKPLTAKKCQYPSWISHLRAVRGISMKKFERQEPHLETFSVEPGCRTRCRARCRARCRDRVQNQGAEPGCRTRVQRHGLHGGEQASPVVVWRKKT